MFALIGVIIVGFISGLIARAIYPGDDQLGFFTTAALGIVGSFTASYLGQLLGFYSNGASVGILAGAIGAVIVLAIYHLFKKMMK